MSKSIFEKAYILKAQAIKAMEKEFGADSQHEVVAKEGVIPARYVIVEKASISWDESAEAAQARVEALKQGIAQAQPMVDDLPSDPAELDFPVAPWVADAQADADKLANAIQVNEAAPSDKPRLSTCEKPTKKVWHIADSMPKASRKEVVAECVRQGIAYGTSRTQYQAWFKASQEALRGDIRKPYEKV